MRLRPSGNQGPVATKLSSFIDYQKSSAWTWEHLALTRARVITGPAALRREIDDTIREVLARPRDRADGRGGGKAMRAQDRGREGNAGHLGPETCAGRADRSRIHRPVPADRERGGASARCSTRIPSCALTKLVGRRGAVAPAMPRFSCRRRGSITRSPKCLQAVSRQAVRGRRGAARAEGPARARRRHAGLRHARSDVEGHARSRARGLRPHREVMARA